jgi:hypothetical protein
MAGHATAAATLRADRERIAGRVLEAFVADDPTARERYDELAMRRLLRDIGTTLDQVSGVLATGDSTAFLSWCEALVPVYRRRGVPMDDLARLAGLLSKAAASVLPLEAASAAATVLEAAGRGFNANRRLGGDAKKRNPVVAFIYKGA